MSKYFAICVTKLSVIEYKNSINMYYYCNLQYTPKKNLEKYFYDENPTVYEIGRDYIYDFSSQYTKEPPTFFFKKWNENI